MVLHVPVMRSMLPSHIVILRISSYAIYEAALAQPGARLTGARLRQRNSGDHNAAVRRSISALEIQSGLLGKDVIYGK